MRQKKLLVSIISVLLISLLIIGCSGVNDVNDQNKEPSKGTDDNGAGQENTVDPDTMFADTLAIEWLVSETAAVPFNLDSLTIQEVKRLLNVDLKFTPVPESDADTKISTLLATDSIPDIISVGSAELQQYANSGMFLNILDYEEQAKDYLGLVLAEDRKNATAKLMVEDGLYGFQILERYRIPVAPQAQIRSDILDELGLEYPNTWDQLYDVLLKMKEAYPDAYAFSSRNGTNYLIGQIAYMMGSGGFMGFNTERGMYLEPDEGKWLYGPTTESFKKVVQFLHDCYANELLDPDYSVMTRDMAFEKLSTGKLYANFDNTTFITSVFNPAFKEVKPDARFDIIPPMSYDGTNTRSYRFERDWTSFMAVSSKVDRPEDVVQFMNWIYTEEGADLLNFGVEGVTYEVVDGTPVLKEDVFNEYKDQDDPYGAFRSHYGLGMYSFALYVDDTFNKDMVDEEFLANGELIDKWTEEGKVSYMPHFPPFTEEEAERLKDLETQIGSVFNQEIDKFIMGTRDMSDYDKFMDELRSQGVEELEKIFNDAEARLAN